MRPASRRILAPMTGPVFNRQLSSRIEEGSVPAHLSHEVRSSLSSTFRQPPTQKRSRSFVDPDAEWLTAMSAGDQARGGQSWIAVAVEDDQGKLLSRRPVEEAEQEGSDGQVVGFTLFRAAF